MQAAPWRDASFLPPQPGHAEGACALPSGRTRVKDRPRVFDAARTQAECEQRCAHIDACTAYEFSAHGQYHVSCKIHTAQVARTVPIPGTLCMVKRPMARMPSYSRQFARPGAWGEAARSAGRVGSEPVSLIVSPYDDDPCTWANYKL